VTLAQRSDRARSEVIGIHTSLTHLRTAHRTRTGSVITHSLSLALTLTRPHPQLLGITYTAPLARSPTVPSCIAFLTLLVLIHPHPAEYRQRLASPRTSYGPITSSRALHPVLVHFSIAASTLPLNNPTLPQLVSILRTSTTASQARPRTSSLHRLRPI
jgi:hypothetical protein